jgi:hypothetical protein
MKITLTSTPRLNPTRSTLEDILSAAETELGLVLPAGTSSEKQGC